MTTFYMQKTVNVNYNYFQNVSNSKTSILNLKQDWLGMYSDV